MSLPSPIRVTCPTHLIILDFITRKILGVVYRSISTSLYSFLHSFFVLCYSHLIFMHSTNLSLLVHWLVRFLYTCDWSFCFPGPVVGALQDRSMIELQSSKCSTQPTCALASMTKLLSPRIPPHPRQTRRIYLNLRETLYRSELCGCLSLRFSFISLSVLV
jgi:hypothetical protein